MRSCRANALNIKHKQHNTKKTSLFGLQIIRLHFRGVRVAYFIGILVNALKSTQSSFNEYCALYGRPRPSRNTVIDDIGKYTFLKWCAHRFQSEATTTINMHRSQPMNMHFCRSGSPITTYFFSRARAKNLWSALRDCVVREIEVLWNGNIIHTFEQRAIHYCWDGDAVWSGLNWENMFQHPFSGLCCQLVGISLVHYASRGSLAAAAVSGY